MSLQQLVMVMSGFPSYVNGILKFLVLQRRRRLFSRKTSYLVNRKTKLTRCARPVCSHRIMSHELIVLLFADFLYKMCKSTVDVFLRRDHISVSVQYYTGILYCPFLDDITSSKRSFSSLSSIIIII